MKNKITTYKLSLVFGVLFILFILGSCEDYLDKAPESTLSEKEIFGSFFSFQGFVEELYNCICDYEGIMAANNQQGFNPGDVMLSTKPLMWDDGNLWSQYNLMYANTLKPDFTYTANSARMRVWPFYWYGIRKANLGLDRLDLLTDATQEEKEFIKGQCLFFRAFFTFELSRFYGGLPYIDHYLTASEEMKLPRLSYRETALKVAADMEEAASLLPVNWDNTQAGQRTLGNNTERITKIHALSYKGKALLYGASPMMSESSGGNAAYDAELCKQAAQAFADVIKVCNETGRYKLQTWETMSDAYWVWSPGNTVRCGGTEVILNPTIMTPNFARFVATRAECPSQLGAGNPTVTTPTHSYLKNYGMANGLPLDDPQSGFNPDDPWKGRDPRFYNDIILDGDEMVISTASAAAADKYAQLYRGGRHKVGSGGSVTGYYTKKFVPKGCNSWDNKWTNWQCERPYMRLADVYLMYAEAALWGYGAVSGSVPGSGLTAEQAINVIRNRAQLPNVSAKFSANQTLFMQEIMRERAVELSFEGHRWFDLRRWNVNTDPKYLIKTALDFDRGTDGKPVNIEERVLTIRVAEKKQNWLPFQVSWTKLYQEFTQNPGW